MKGVTRISDVIGLRNDNLDYENRPRKNSITQADMEAIRSRYVEQAELRQRIADANLLRAIELGKALKALKDESEE